MDRRVCLTIGSSGPEVKRIKTLLNQQMHLVPKLVENDHFDARTDRAVKLFQIDNNLGVSGEVDSETQAALTTNKRGARAVTLAVATPATPWMKIAKGEIGQEEIPGNSHNPRIISYHATTSLKASTDETPWCSSFVNWVMKEAGIKGTNSAAAISWVQWGKASPAKQGSIVILNSSKSQNSSLSYSGNHVGFLVKETSTHYHILGGNQRNKVKESRYPKKNWKLKGCRWPNS